MKSKRSGPLFFTKIGVPLGVFWRCFCEIILNQKHQFGSKSAKIGHLFPYIKTSIHELAEFCGTLRNVGRQTDVNRVVSAPILHAPHSRMTCVCQRQTPSNNLSSLPLHVICCDYASALFRRRLCGALAAVCFLATEELPRPVLQRVCAAAQAVQSSGAMSQRLR